MRPPAKHLVAALSLAVVALASRAGAQGADTLASPLLTLRPGLPIRLASPSLGLSGDMSVLRATSDTVVVVGRFGERAVPRAAIRRLDVYQGNTARGGIMRGAKIGAVVGVVNALLCATSCLPEDRTDALILSVPAFSALGGAIGMLFRADSWARLLPRD